MSHNEARAAFAAAFFESFFEGPEKAISYVDPRINLWSFALTSSLELTTVDRHLRLELSMLWADGLRAAETDVCE